VLLSRPVSVLSFGSCLPFGRVGRALVWEAAELTRVDAHSGRRGLQWGVSTKHRVFHYKVWRNWTVMGGYSLCWEILFGWYAFPGQCDFFALLFLRYMVGGLLLACEWLFGHWSMLCSCYVLHPTCLALYGWPAWFPAMEELDVGFGMSLYKWRNCLYKGRKQNVPRNHPWRPPVYHLSLRLGGVDLGFLAFTSHLYLRLLAG